MHGLARATKGGILAVMFAVSPVTASAQDDKTQEEVIQHLRDRAAIEDLFARYLVALDTGDHEAYASVFTKDADLRFSGNHLEGRTEIREAMKGALRSPEEDAPGGAASPNRLRHLVSHLKIDIEGDRATVRANWATISNARVGRPNIGGMGYYDDVLVKRDGEWLIKSRDIVVELAAPSSDDE